MEIWDAYYADGTKAGIDLIRDKAIPENLFHAVAEILVQHTDGSYLLMRRDCHKKGFPGYWEVGAGGSILKGETFLEGAKRELLEETGIQADKLQPIIQKVMKKKRAIVCYFFCLCDIPKDAIILQEGETIDHRWVTKAELLQHLDSTSCIPQQREWVRAYVGE